MEDLTFPEKLSLIGHHPSADETDLWKMLTGIASALDEIRVDADWRSHDAAMAIVSVLSDIILERARKQERPCAKLTLLKLLKEIRPMQ